MNEFPEGWKPTLLGDSGKWLSGGTPSTSNPEYWNGDIPWISSGSLTNFRLWDSDRRVTDLGVANGTRMVNAGTILMVVRGMSLKTEFRHGIAQGDMTFGQDCKALVAGPGIDPEFLAYAIAARSQYILGIVDEAGHGTGRLNSDQLYAVEIGVPPWKEQKAITEVLSALDDKIAANTKQVETADELAASLTRQALDVSGSVALSTIADIVMGSSPSGASFNEIGEGTVFYQGVRDFGVRFPSNRVWTNAPVRLAGPGDTLLSVRAPVGRVNLATEETCIGRGVASVRSSSGRPFTLFHLLKDSHEAWAPFEAEGTVFGSINKIQLASLPVPSIRAEQEERLERQLAPIERTIASALAENANLAATRDALLPQLMSGRLRVKDVQTLVSAVV